MVKDNTQSNVTFYIAYGNRICLLLIYVASGPITSWQIDGEKVETVTDFIFLGSKITANEKNLTADRDCTHEIRRCSLLG